MKNDPVEEQISAWLDDELPPAEMELFFSRLARSEEYRDTAARYALGGALIQGRRVPAAAGADLRERVRRALDAESEGTGVTAATEAVPAPAPAISADRRRWLPAAAAAALGAVAVGVGLNLRQEPPSGATVADTVPAPAFPGANVRDGAIAPASEGFRRTDRLTSYLVYHGEYSSPISTKVLDSHIVNQRPYVVTVSTVERMRHD